MLKAGGTRRALWLAALMSLHPASASAQQRTAEHGSESVNEVVLLGRSVVHATTSPRRWDRQEVRTAAALVVALAALSSVDEAGRTFMRSNRSSLADDLTREIERLGTVQNFAVLGGLLAAGVALDDGKARAVAVEGLASSIVAGALITPTLQFVLGRSRPRRNERAHTFHAFSGNISLPSGHTTQAFAVASVIATEYNNFAVQVAAYGLAGGVAVSRMYHDAHYLSDVAAAALIGTLVGRSVAHYGQTVRRGMRIEPVGNERGGYGVQVTLPVR
jgi:membrane-associated phospholipid phosphatase